MNDTADPVRAEALLRRWHSARLTSRGVPAYEDVVLGNLGRAAGRVALVAVVPEGAATILWGGDEFEAWLGGPARNVAVAGLREGLGHSLSQIVADAGTGGEPVRTRCNRVSGGVVLTTDLIGLPLRERGGGRFVLLCLAGETTRTNLLRAVFRATGQGMLALSALRDEGGRAIDFQIVALNEATATMFGRRVEEVLWQRLTAVLPDLPAATTLARLTDALGRQGRLVYETAYRRDDGTLLHLRVEVASLGDLLGLTLTDIGDMKAREASARLLFETNPLPMWVCGEDGLFLAVNDAAVDHYGYARRDFLAMSVADLGASGADPAPGGVVAHRRRDGGAIEVTTYSRAIPFEGRPATLTAVVDVTEMRRAEARIVHMAHHDALTDLPNRVLFRARLTEAMAGLPGRAGCVGLLCLDLDHFKVVNDSLGHPAGDDLLRQVSSRLRICAAQAGTVARLGGDEFAIVVGAERPEAVVACAEAVVAALSRPFGLAGQEVTVGVSIGVALAPEHGTDPDLLLRKGDMALYAAKAEGRRTVRLFEPTMDAALQARRALEADLRAAVAAGALDVHYQPILSVRSLAVTGCEALLRWHHPERGFVSPAEFVPVAEEAGLIGQIGEWVLRTACREAAGWPEPLRIAVNLSPVQFRNPGLALGVAAALAATGLPAHRLELEITETVLLSENAANIAMLHALRDLGVRIAIDDFGTGYSSLSYLRAFPFDKIKIDRSFTRALGLDGHSTAIVRAVIELGASLGITTVAEGVETQEQFLHLRAGPCDEVQGFLFGRPVPAAELRRLLATCAGSAAASAAASAAGSAAA